MSPLGVLLLTSLGVVGQFAPGSTHEHIKDFGYFVGTWTVQDDTGKASGQVSYEWVNDKNFLMSKWKMPEGTTSMSMLGWDPTSKKITEWGFGDFGGFGTMVWENAGDQKWISKTKGVWTRWNGDQFEVTTTTTIVDNDHCTMETTVPLKEQPVHFTSKLTRSGKRPDDAVGPNYGPLKFLDYYVGQWRLEGELPEGKYVGEELNTWAFRKNVQRTAGWGRTGEGERLDYEILTGWDPVKEKVFLWIAGSDGSSSVREGTYDPQKRCVRSRQRSVDGKGVEMTATVEERHVDADTFVIKFTEVIKNNETQPDAEITATRINK